MENHLLENHLLENHLWKKREHEKSGRGKYLAAALTLSAVLGLCSGCGSAAKDQKVSKSDFYFDTVITITLFGTEDTAPIDGCFALASKYENLFSNTIPESEISQINSAAGIAPVKVSPETLQIIQDGLYYYQLSEGAFDITVGGLSSLWNVSEICSSLENEDMEADPSVIPSEQAIQSALENVGCSYLTMDGDQVMLTNPDTTLDLGAIAKGYIADRMKEYLISENVSSAMINLGGNVLLVGSKPDGSDFRCGVQKPFAGSDLSAVLSVSDRSLVTSGIYERYFKVDGRIYHHLLDLSTGYPCENDLYGVTIISDSSMDGDALSTTCFALGLDKGMELIESLDDTEAIFITSDLKLHKSSGIGHSIPCQIP